MKREIKFRGKRLNTDEWVYGGVGYKGDQTYITTQEKLGGYDAPVFVYVDPSTVGQYTGLKDKNGREIYEGDVIGELKLEVSLTPFSGVLVARGPMYADPDDLIEMEVTGNIHDK